MKQPMTGMTIAARPSFAWSLDALWANRHTHFNQGLISRQVIG